MFANICSHNLFLHFTLLFMFDFLSLMDLSWESVGNTFWIFILLKISLLCPQTWMMVYLGIEFLVNMSISSALWRYCLLFSSICCCLWGIYLQCNCLFCRHSALYLLIVFKILSLSLMFCIFRYSLFRYGLLVIYPDFSHSWTWEGAHVAHQFWKLLVIIFSNIASFSLSLSFPSGMTIKDIHSLSPLRFSFSSMFILFICSLSFFLALLKIC